MLVMLKKALGLLEGLKLEHTILLPIIANLNNHMI